MNVETWEKLRGFGTVFYFSFPCPDSHIKDTQQMSGVEEMLVKATSSGESHMEESK